MIEADFRFPATHPTAQRLQAIPHNEYFFHPPVLGDGTVLLNCPPTTAEEIRQKRKAELCIQVDALGLRLALRSKDHPPVPFNLGDGTLVAYDMQPRRAFDQSTMSIRTERTEDGGWYIPEQSGLTDTAIVRDCLDILAERMKMPKLAQPPAS